MFYVYICYHLEKFLQAFLEIDKLIKLRWIREVKKGIK